MSINIAFLVGCSKYDDPDINDLRFAAEDAKSVGTSLQSTCAIKAEHIVSLSSDASIHNLLPTRNNIIRELSRPLRQGFSLTRKIDRLFFFFSGHGYHSPQDDKDYLLGQDAVGTSLEDTSIAIDSVVSYLKSWGAICKLVFIDACRAAPSGGRSTQWEPITNKSLLVNGFATLWSCRPGQKSYETESLGSGLFTFALVGALGEEGHCNTVYEIDQYLQMRVVQLCEKYQFPIQNPYSQVEPLEIQNSQVVSESVYLRNRSLCTVGPEIRRDVTFPFDEQVFRSAEICGIDFGTSYSVVALALAPNVVKFVPAPSGRYLVPSVVAITSQLQFIVGQEAIEFSRLSPSLTFYNIKRLFGTAGRFSIGGRSLAPEEITSLLIRSLVKNIEEYAHRRPTAVLASVPANFTIAQCNSLVESFRLADVTLRRLVAEPSAAACVLLHDSPASALATEEGLVAVVIDLGGGTFDVAVIESAKEVELVEILSLGGDRTLGGVDFDTALEQYLAQEVAKAAGASEFRLNELEHFRLREEAERAKIALGSADTTSAIVRNVECGDRGLVSVEIPITRELFVELTADLNRRFEECVSSTVKKAGERGAKIDVILLAGQGAKIFCIRQMIGQMFPGIRIEDKYQETAVAAGMGFYSGVLRGINKTHLLLDAISFGVGFKCLEHVEREEAARDDEGNLVASFAISTDASKNSQTVCMVPDGTTIPTRKSELGRVTGQGDQLSIKFVESGTTGLTEERELEIGTARIPLDKATAAKIEVEIELDVDADRTILASIIDHSSKQVFGFQLNNFFIEAKHLLEFAPENVKYGSTLAQSRVRAGFKLHPIQKIRKSD